MCKVSKGQLAVSDSCNVRGGLSLLVLRVKVEVRLREEAERARHYLDASTEEPIVKVMTAELVWLVFCFVFSFLCYFLDNSVVVLRLLKHVAVFGWLSRWLKRSL